MRLSTLRGLIVALAVIASLGVAADAAAQMSVPLQGEGYVSLVYSSSASKKHLLPITEHDIGRVDSHALLADITFGLTDRIAVSVGLPLVAGRYLGEFPHQRTNPERLDDGRWHTAWQDFRFGLSYNALNGPLMLTPFVGGVAPSHGYEYFAHAAAGRQLKELQAGVALSVLLNRIHPGVFFDSRYSFGFVQQNVNVRPNHSNLDLEAGYFVTPSLRLFFLSAGQWSHDGIDVTIPVTLPAEVFAHHDQIDKVHYLKIGGGASFELTDSMSVYGAFSKQVAGRNGHKVYRAISVGMTWSFRTQKQTLFGTTSAAPAGPASPVAWSPYPQRAGM